MKGKMEGYVKVPRLYLVNNTTSAREKAVDCKVVVRQEDGTSMVEDINPVEIPRENEFATSSDFLILSSVAKYICTHFTEGNGLHEALWDYQAVLPLDIFTTLAIGEEEWHRKINEESGSEDTYSQLKRKLREAIAAANRVVVFREDDGLVVKGTIFVCHLIADDNPTLQPAGIVRKLENTGHEKNGKVRFSFNKSIFRKYLPKGESYYQYPAALYAKSCTLLLTLTEDTLRKAGEKEKDAKLIAETLRGKMYLSCILKGIDFLYLNGAGMPTRQECEEFKKFKEKETSAALQPALEFQGYSVLKIPAGQFFKAAKPSLVYVSPNKIAIRNERKTTVFIRILHYLLLVLDKHGHGLDFRLKTYDGWNADYVKTGSLEFKICHSRRILDYYCKKWGI
jgi:hypothetical protein